MAITIVRHHIDRDTKINVSFEETQEGFVYIALQMGDVTACIRHVERAKLLAEQLARAIETMEIAIND